MIESDRQPYIYGEILSRSLYAAGDEPSGAATFISQGAVVGALTGFMSLVNSMLSYPENGYNFFLMLFLPPILAGGMAFGAFVGSIIWAASYLARRRLHLIARACIGMAVQAVLTALFYSLYSERSPYQEDPSESHYFLGVVTYIGFGFLFGLATGPRFEPWYELVRGMASSRWRAVLTGITGLALRVAVIFAFMESVLNLIWQQQREFESSEFTIAAIAVGHFVVATVIVLVRMPTWVLVPLALLINFPVVMFITDVLTPKDGPLRTLSIVYLALWAAFMLTRMSVPRALLSSLKKELRYYLID
jgi:hypothetical protein